MKRILFGFLGALMLFCPSVMASENYIKIKYLPVRDHEARVIECVINENLGGNDRLIRDVYDKLKDLQTLGRLDYIVPDASSITIEVHYQGEILKSANALDVEKPAEFLQYEKNWEQAYALVWEAVRKNLDLKLPAPAAVENAPLTGADCEQNAKSLKTGMTRDEVEKLTALDGGISGIYKNERRYFPGSAKKMSSNFSNEEFCMVELDFIPPGVSREVFDDKNKFSQWVQEHGVKQSPDDKLNKILKFYESGLHN